MDNSTISLVIADDHPLILAGIATLIEAEPELVLLGQATDADGAVEQYERLRPDVLLVDLNMPGGGLEAIARVRARHPDAKIGPHRQTAALYDVFPAHDRPMKPAGEWNTSEVIVKGKHVTHILNKLGVANRREAAAAAAKLDLL